MSQPNIKAEKINSPIQLMAAWFVMLILLSSVLLAAASQIKEPSWASGYLVISTTVLILIVISSVILMFTKFRPHLQEGKEYAQWLKDKNQYSEGIVPEENTVDTSEELQNKFKELKSSAQDTDKVDVLNEIEESLLYKVLVSDVDEADKVIAAMSEFKVESNIHEINIFYEKQSKKQEYYEGIWIGSKVPAEVAIPIIKKAISIWPHLKYIAFPSKLAPDEIQWQIYIGGTTSTAVSRGYKAWTNDEINSLEIKETDLFHEDIKNKIP